MWSRAIFLLLAADAVLGLASALTFAPALMLLMENFELAHAHAVLALGAMGTAAGLFGLACAWAIDRLTTLWLPLAAAAVGVVLRVALAAAVQWLPPAQACPLSLGLLALLAGLDSVLVAQPLVLYLDGQIERHFADKEANSGPQARIFAVRYSLGNGVMFLATIVYDLLRTFAPSVRAATTMVQWLSVGSSFLLVAVLVVALAESPPAPLRPHPPAWAQVRALLRDRGLWGFTAMCMFLLSTSSVFRHIEQTLPSVMQRLFTADVHFARIQAINPALIILLAPAVQWATAAYKGYWVIVAGTLVSSLSLLPLVVAGGAPRHGPAALVDYLPYVLFMGLFSLGEALWSARFTAFALAAAGEDRKALFGAVAAIPQLAARPFAAWHSAWLVQRHCPSDAQCAPAPLWGTVAGLSLIAPAALTLLNRWLDPMRQRDVYGTGA
jgi:hypothetical protein